MINRIEVGLKPRLKDTLGENLKERIKKELRIKKSFSLRVIAVYILRGNFSKAELSLIRRELFTDPLIECSRLNIPLARSFDWLIEVGFKPGVTDDVGKTAREGIEDILKRKLEEDEAVYTAKQYLFKGELNEPEIKKIAFEFLANSLIERVTIKSFKEWRLRKLRKEEKLLPVVEGVDTGEVEEISLEGSDEELAELSSRRVLALTVEEMKTIRDYFKNPEILKERTQRGLSDKPSDVELEALAQTWSEHCKHKIFNAFITYTDERGRKLKINSLFNTYIKKATQKIAPKFKKLVSVFHDNAGVVEFNEDWNLVFKVETHNSPSALDPYGGALTGIVGVNRDPFGTGLGAKLLFNVDTFCFAPPEYKGKLPPRLHHPKRIFEGVRRGVEHGGNKSGIPTINGNIVFDPRFAGKPLVYCGTGGIMPKRIKGIPSEEKKVKPGDLVVMVGGRIGKDGIHGATFSSEELHETSPTSAVQIGSPITQKKMTDFLLEARDELLYRAITDNGAGGLSSSVGEMARLSGGCEIYLEKCPLKYHGLLPWEILLSEAQERMTLAVPPEKINRFLTLAQRRSVEASVIGKFTDSGKFIVQYKEKTVAFLEMKFFHEGLPQMKLNAIWKPPVFEEPSLPEPKDFEKLLKKILRRLNVCSKEAIIRQYDHEVQGQSVIKPLVGKANDGPSDAAVIKPLINSKRGIVVSSGICPKYSDIDTYWMVACSIDEAIRNNIAVGGALEEIALLDNFCWPDPIKSKKTPDGEYKLAQLVRANQALAHFTRSYATPLISGKDSMKNDYQIGKVKISIPPTVLISALGQIEDVEKAVTMDVKAPGDLVYLVGITKDELGGSEYYRAYGYIGNNVPKVSAKENKKIYQKIHQAIQNQLIASCHDLSDGGLGVALAESAFAGGYGMEIFLDSVPREKVTRDDTLLFSESQARFIITLHPQNKKKWERIIKGIPASQIGQVISKPYLIIHSLKGEKLMTAKISSLKRVWKSRLV